MLTRTSSPARTTAQKSNSRNRGKFCASKSAAQNRGLLLYLNGHFQNSSCVIFSRQAALSVLLLRYLAVSVLIEFRSTHSQIFGFHLEARGQIF